MVGLVAADMNSFNGRTTPDPDLRLVLALEFSAGSERVLSTGSPKKSCHRVHGDRRCRRTRAAPGDSSTPRARAVTGRAVRHSRLGPRLTERLSDVILLRTATPVATRLGEQLAPARCCRLRPGALGEGTVS